MSFFCFLGDTGSACKETFPFRLVRREREEENVRDAEACEARCRVFFLRSQSLTHRGPPRQTPQPFGCQENYAGRSTEEYNPRKVRDESATGTHRVARAGNKNLVRRRFAPG